MRVTREFLREYFGEGFLLEMSISIAIKQYPQISPSLMDELIKSSPEEEIQDIINGIIEDLYETYRNAEIRFVEYGVAAFKLSDIRKNLGKVRFEERFKEPFDESESIVEIDGEYYLLTLIVEEIAGQKIPQGVTGFDLN